MRSLIVLLALLLLPSSTGAITCHVGPQGQTMLVHGFDYCISSLNQLTDEINYDGRSGPTNKYDREPSNLASGECFYNIKGTPSTVNCYCRADKCNHRISNSGFRRLMFGTRPF